MTATGTSAAIPLSSASCTDVPAGVASIVSIIGRLDSLPSLLPGQLVCASFATTAVPTIPYHTTLRYRHVARHYSTLRCGLLTLAINSSLKAELLLESAHNFYLTSLISSTALLPV